MASSKVFWICGGLSLALFLITCWSAIYADTTPYWVESIGYFILTFYCMELFKGEKTDISTWLVVSAVIIGRIIIEIPMRIMDWNGCLGSFMVIAACVIAILLSAYCFNTKKPFAFILSYVILSLFNSIVAEYWTGFVLNR